MINQVTGPASTSDVFYSMRVLLLITLLSMSYELSRPQAASDKEQHRYSHLSDGMDQTPEWDSLLPWQRKASEKAIERYTKAQEKKWQRWNEAMFERSD